MVDWDHDYLVRIDRDESDEIERMSANVEENEQVDIVVWHFLQEIWYSMFVVAYPLTIYSVDYCTQEKN